MHEHQKYLASLPEIVWFQNYPILEDYSITPKLGIILFSRLDPYRDEFYKIGYLEYTGSPEQKDLALGVDNSISEEPNL